MVSFAAVTPDDAEVLRNAHWIRYDAASLVVGDVVRLDNYDIVPADCVILAYGFHDKLEISNEIENDDEEEKMLLTSKAAAAAIDNNNHEECEEEGLILTVDARLITGESNMTHYSPSSLSSTSSSKSSLQTLLYGSQIVNGSCIAIVTAIGNNVVLSKLITSKRWPPKYDMSHEIYDIFNMEINNL
jgi:magnesium-transporting ATPase (P-type)